MTTDREGTAAAPLRESLFGGLPTAPWPPRNRRDLIEHAKAAYIVHGRLMAEDYPHLAPQTPWDDQDAAVREAWIEHVTPEQRGFAEWKPGDGWPLPPVEDGGTADASASGGRSSVGSAPGPAADERDPDGPVADGY